MKKFLPFVLLFLTISMTYSQGKFILQDDRESDKIRFKLINNLIIIPIEINGAEFSFILDSGVRKPIIFNLLHVNDSLAYKNSETILLRGLGSGDPIKALRSKNNFFKIGDAININQTMYMVFSDKLNFSPRLGIPVHGIVGYDLFNDFIVEINYNSKVITLNDPLKYEYRDCKKCETFNLEFDSGKPYFNVFVNVNKKKIPTKLLIDSGGSDALWLFEEKERDLVLDKKYFHDFIGYGLSGSVYGKRSRVDKIYIKSFELSNVNVAFPDSASISYVKQFKERNGSFSGGLLKRFNVIMDYHNAKITLKKSKYFKEPFSYNKSGMEIAQTGITIVEERDNNVQIASNHIVHPNTVPKNNQISFVGQYKFNVKPAYSIIELQKDSPAERIGLQKGDLLTHINGRPSYNYNLQQLIAIFYGEDNKKIRLKVERKGIPLTFIFRLEDPLK